MKVRIGVAQMKVKYLDIEGNLKKAKSMISEASGEGCDIIGFPEIFLTGPLVEKNADYAQEIPGEYTEEFCRMARENSIYIVMGSITEKANDGYYNTSVLIDDHGNIVGKYRKIQLWNGEKIYKRSGNELPVFNTKFGKIGLEICWDLAFPEITKELALKGAKIIICPSLWSHDDTYDLLSYKSEALKKKISNIQVEAIFVDSCIPARAIENEVAFVYINGCGKLETESFTRNLLGHSQIAVPFYGTIASLEDEEKLLIKEVDLDLLDLAEETYEIKKSSREREKI